MANEATLSPLPIAHLGPEGTFSEEAVLKLFPSEEPRLPCATFDAVLEFVETGRAQGGVIAIENNTNGTVTHAMDLLLNTSLIIVAEVTVPIIHNLMGKVRSLEEIQVIYAHPQALAQCEHWLHGHVPQAQQIPVASNAEGARRAASESGVAGIAAARAADIYGVNILAPAIQDGLSNQTRFFLMSAHADTFPQAKVTKWKTSIVFSVPNRPGALYDVISYFAEYGVQMVRIESRPARNGTWDYNFYIDVEGKLEDKAVQGALQKVAKTVDFYRCFGSYPVLDGRVS